MCITLLMPTAAVADALSTDELNSFLQQFDVDLNDPESIQKALDTLQGSGLLGGLTSILGFDIEGIISELQEYLFAFETETTTEEPTTEEETTEAPTTEPTTEPTTIPQVYNPQNSYTPPAYSEITTVPETTTFQYIPPEQIYTEAFTTAVFNPVIDDNLNTAKATNPLKTAAGIILLAGSGIGVFVVALALKRNRI